MNIEDNINTNSRESSAHILIRRYKPEIEYTVVDGLGNALPDKTIVVVVNNKPLEFTSDSQGKFSLKVPCEVYYILSTRLLLY